jgi:hypothetical protein
MKRTLLFPIALAALALACDDGPEGPGRLSVALSGAPATTADAAQLPGVEAIWVNVTAVRAHSEADGWITLDAAPVRLNLLALADAGVDLGLATLPAGRVTQLRLMVAPEGNVVVLDGGAELPLTVPSGVQSGIKVNGPWDVDACEETALALELDGHRSIWAHDTGQGEEWILRPVIRTARVVQEPTSCEPEPACVPAECASGRCDASGACAPGGASTPCAADAECLSNACVEASCAPGGEGAPCREAGDCGDALACLEAVCAPVSAPPL